MAEIADLIVKIGADPSQLAAGMKEAKAAITKGLDPSTVKAFQKALDGAASSMGSIIGLTAKFKLASFLTPDLMPSVRGAVQAANNLRNLSAMLGTTTAEASRFSKAMTLAGGDAQSAGVAIMRLDKNISGTGDAAEKARRVLSIFGVSLTDSSGKLLPVTQQMQNLAEGFKKAQDAGYGQEYLLNTLGSRGLALVNVLNNYAQAADHAAKVQGVGLDVQQLHEIGLELDTLKLQAGQFGNVFGAAVAPVVSEILPPLTQGLGEAAKLLADNREQVGGLLRVLAQFALIRKALSYGSLVTKVGSVASNVLGGAGQISKAVEQQNTLSRIEEAAIAKRERMIESVALADERRKIKEVNATQLTEEEKTSIIAKYSTERQALAAKESAAIRLAMTKRFAEETAAATSSANTQAAALAKVNTAAAVTGAGITRIGTNAGVAGAATVSSMGRASVAVAGMVKVVWALAGGWLGVAAAVGVALTSLYKFYKAERQKAANDAVYTYNGRNYQYDAEGNTMVRLKDNGTRMNVYDPNENNAAYQAALSQGLDPEKAAKGNDELGKAQEDYKQAVEDSRNEMEELLASLQEEKDAANESSKAEKISMPSIPKEPVMRDVEVPVGQIAARNAIKAYTDAPGSQWENDELTRDLSNSCAAFVATMWKQAGIDALYTASGNNMDKQFQDAGAWHGEEWEPYLEAGDYVSGPKHVGMYVGNGQVISRDSSGGLQQRDLQDWKNTFGFLGYGSIRQFTNGQTGTESMSDAMASQQEALRKLQEARNQAVTLFTQMQNEIRQQTGTAWSQGMDKIAQDVQAKQQEINKLQGDGVPVEAIKQLEGKLAEYRETLMDQVERKRKESLDKMTAETRQSNAEIAGDYKAAADAEYEATLQALAKEREEREKEVTKNKEDKEAMAAVEDWYAAKTEEAARKRADAYRDAFEKQVRFSIENRDWNSLKSNLDTNGSAYMDWKGETEEMEAFYSIWEEAHESTAGMTADFMKSMDSGINNIFNDCFDNFGNMKNMVKDVGNLILKTIAQIALKMAAAKFVMGLFGGGSSNTLTAGNALIPTNNPYAYLGIQPFASGGVVTAPTLAMVGEGASSEAVLPLNDSTYSNFARNIASRIGSGGAVKVVVNNYGNDQVKAESNGYDTDTGAQIINITVGEFQKNTDGSLDALKAMLGR